MAKRHNSRIKPFTKVKTGCRTCKIRKVKCDEGRPSCQRCLSTGRVCDGYGIWGGGGNRYEDRVRLIYPEKAPSPETPIAVWLPMSSAQEKGFFDWFQHRTSTKLPGTFESNFWKVLLHQASVQEPAVLHAVIALSSVHRGETAACLRQKEIEDDTNKRETFMLQNYIKAINFLRSHCSAKDKSSLRVALITCVVFVCLELLRGHFRTAQLHLKHGLEAAGEMRLLRSYFDKDPQSALSENMGDVADNWIIEALSRLRLQVQLFHQACRSPCPVLIPYPRDISILRLESINDAWEQLDRITSSIFELRYENYSNLFPTIAALQQQKRVKAHLVQWNDTYEVFKRSHIIDKSSEEEKTFAVLELHHTMATIMAATCLANNDELQYDSYTEMFCKLLGHAVDLWVLSKDDPDVSALPGHRLNMSHSVIDLGWMAPLYYTAIKCRIHRIRTQAIKLLECTSHREGIWDAKITACVTRKVVALEERDLFSQDAETDTFSASSLPSAKELLQPQVSESYRLHEVEMVLPGSPVDKILLYCNQQLDGVERRTLLSEYDLRLGKWVDATVNDTYSLRRL